MSPLRFGATSLGLDTQWRFHFIAPQRVTNPSYGTIYFDLGGSCTHGIIDSHQSEDVAGSTAELVLRFPEFVYGHLMNAWLQRRDDGQVIQGRVWSPALVTHRNPDFDGLVSTFLIQEIVENGTFPACAAALATYVSLVDQGRIALDPASQGSQQPSMYSLHLGYLALQNLSPPQGHERQQWCLERGLTMLRHTLAVMQSRRTPGRPWKAEDFFQSATSASPDPGCPDFAAWSQREEFADVVALIDQDCAAFAEDQGDATLLTVHLPAVGAVDTAIPVPTFVAQRQPRSKLNKYWVRAAGYPFFICPYDLPIRGTTAEQARRVILSLDPLWRDGTGRAVSLRGLGAALERAECRLRERSPLGDTRDRTPRWPDGSVNNADPWYDGRGHEYTIVDSPAEGTLLPFAQVVDVATGPFWHTPLAKAELILVVPFDPTCEVGSPGSPSDAAPSSRRHGGLTNATPSFEPWLTQCRDCPLADQAPWPLATGLELVSHRLRTLPIASLPPWRILTLQTTGPGAATLEGIAAWLQDLNARYANKVYLLTLTEISPGQDHQGIELLQNVCMGMPLHAVTDKDPSAAVILFNRRAIAVHKKSIGSDVDPQQTEEYLELLMHTVYQAERLEAFSHDAVKAVSTGTWAHAAGKLRKDLLVFEASFFHLELVRDDIGRTLYSGIRAAMGIDAQHAKVSRELAHLASLAQRRADSVLAAIMAVVGYAAVVQAVFLDWGDASLWHAFAAIGLGVVGLVVYAHFGSPGLLRRLFLTSDGAGAHPCPPGGATRPLDG